MTPITAGLPSPRRAAFWAKYQLRTGSDFTHRNAAMYIQRRIFDEPRLLIFNAPFHFPLERSARFKPIPLRYAGPQEYAAGSPNSLQSTHAVATPTTPDMARIFT